VYILYIMSKRDVFEYAPRALQIPGFFILLACFGDMTKNRLIGTLTGYGFIFVGIMVFVILLMQSTTEPINVSGIVSLGPFIMIMILIWILVTMIIKNFDKISSGQVSSSFSNMIKLNNILLMLILVIANRNNQTNVSKLSDVISSKEGAALYLLSILSSVILVTIYIILEIYPTDGFVSKIDNFQ